MKTTAFCSSLAERILDLLGANRTLQKAVNSGSVPDIGRGPCVTRTERTSRDKARELQDAASALANVSFGSIASSWSSADYFRSSPNCGHHASGPPLPKSAKRRIGAFRARSAKPTIPSLDHSAVDEVLEQMPALHAGGGTLCQLDGEQFFFGVYGEAGSEYAAPHCIAL